jgi:hypothetical protein
MRQCARREQGVHREYITDQRRRAKDCCAGRVYQDLGDPAREAFVRCRPARGTEPGREDEGEAVAVTAASVKGEHSPASVWEGGSTLL